MTLSLNNQVVGDTCYRIAGDINQLPVVILIHGVGLEQSLWDEWVEGLQASYAVVTFDLLGHGGSANPAGERAVTDFCDQLQTLVESLGIIKFHLVGFSLGALVSLAYAATRAEQMQSVTLLHSVFRRSEKQMAAIESRYEITRNEGPMATVELALQRWFSSAWLTNNQSVATAIRATFKAHIDDGYLKAYRAFCDADEYIEKIELDLIRCPCLLITGSLEPGSTPAMSRELGALLNGKVIINEGHLHMALVEHRALLVHQVSEFLGESE